MNHLDRNLVKPNLSLGWIGLVLLSLILLSYFNLETFHLVAEIFAVFFALSIFSITWNARNFMRNHFFLLIGNTFLLLGILNLFHLLLFMQMIANPLFNSPLQISLTIYQVFGGSLIIAPYFLNHRLSYPKILMFLVGLSVLFLALTAFLEKHFFQVHHHQLFLIVNLIVFTLLVLGALATLYKKRRYLDRSSFRLLIIANLGFIPTMISQTLYPEGGVAFTVAHLLRIVSEYLYFQVVIQAGLLAPYLELSQSREELAAEKERLDVTLRSLGEGVIATDNSGQIILINRVAEELTGWKQVEAKGQPLDEVFTVTFLPKQQSSDELSAADPPKILVSRDNRLRFVAITGAVMRDHHNQIVGNVLVFRDVTEKRKMEEELLKNEKLKSLGILAGGIAHDFHNILAVLLGNVQLSKLLLEKQKDIYKYLNGMEDSIKRASRLTKQLLTFSKGGLPIKHRINLGDLLTDTANFALNDWNAEYQFANSSEVWPVEADEGQISQVFNNLLINAAQAMPEGGLIRICTENIYLLHDETIPLPEGRYVKVVIQDHGVGIAKQNLPYVFDPFFTTKSDGNGLGLAAAHSIIQRHEGHITVESEFGVGTTFTVYLPACFED